MNQTQIRPGYLSGRNFESLLEACSANYGEIDALPLTRANDFNWEIGVWTAPQVGLSRSRFRSEWQVRTPPAGPEKLLIVVPREGGFEISRAGQSVQVLPGTLILTHSHEPDNGIFRGDSHYSDALLLDWSLIAKAVSSVLDVPLVGKLELQPFMDLSGQIGTVVGGIVQTLAEGLRDDGPLFYSPLAITHLSDALADVIIRSLPHRLSYLLEKSPHLIAPWHVRRAIEFMHANIAQPLTVSAIAESTGVSVRALEYSFKSFKGTTPTIYLRSIRLKAAREDLCAPGNQQSVREICLKWGFFHFGRFSIAYRAAYGESPSETLKRTAAA